MAAPIDLLSRYPITCTIIFRFVNAIASRAFFQPDEYWQSLEVAHRLVYGYGFETWEWRSVLSDPVGRSGTWKQVLTTGGAGGIRSPLYPAMFVPVYWLLKVTHLDETFMLTLAPRILQALFATAMDLSLRRLARIIIGQRFSTVALFCSLSSFFHFHAATRTLSNSTETCLTTMALAWWPWDIAVPRLLSRKDENATANRNDGARGNITLALVLAALATIMRPSNAVIWLLLGGHLLWSATSKQRNRVIYETLAIGVLASVLCFAWDTDFYGTPTFTPLRFLQENVFKSVSLFYGANASHFYFTQALPILTFTQLPFVLHGVWITFARRGVPQRGALRILGTVTAGTIAAYSLLSHKEWRFIHPLLPVMHLFASVSLVDLAPHTRAASSSSFLDSPTLRRSHILLLLLALPPALYFTAFNAQAQTGVMQHLRQLEPDSIGFLMPCHSTPWQAYLHRPELEEGGKSGYGGRMWFIGCEPPVLGQDPMTYLDQSDIFYADPAAYIRARFPAKVDDTWPPSPSVASTQHLSNVTHAWPSHFVVFGALLDDGGTESEVGALLREKGYVVERKLWNGLFGWHEDERRKGGVILLRWQGGSMTDRTR